MKIEDNKIVKATEYELYNLYLVDEMDDIMDFNEYKAKMERAGWVVVDE